MLQRRSLRMYCFSPPVMAITAIVELSLMVWSLYKYRHTKVGRLTAALLFFLAAFQVAEYNICGRFGLNAEWWSRFGFMVIAVLPPLGIHLSLTIAKADWTWLKRLAYASAAVWIGLFGFTNNMFADHGCGGNYILFHVKPHYGILYGLHYYFWLFVGIALSLWLLRGQNKVKRESLLMMVIGYLVFIVPTALVNTIKPETLAGVPSILCGFAIFFAVILAFGILPNEHRPVKKVKAKMTTRKRIR